MESLVSHLVAALFGAGVVWYANRSVRRQFYLMMETIDAGKVEGKDWRFLRDESGNLKGFRVIASASAPTDRPGSL